MEFTENEIELLISLLKAEIETGSFTLNDGEAGVEMNRDETLDCIFGILDKLEG